jgi:hypothetical protein
MNSSNPDGVQSKVPDQKVAFRMQEPFYSMGEADVRPALFLMKSSVPDGSNAVEVRL